METSTILWIGGIAVVAVGAYIVCKNGVGDPRKEFLLKKTDFSALIGGLSTGKFSIEAWTEKIVSINNKVLINWWKNLVRRNNNELNSVKKALIACLTSWGIDIELPANPRLAKKAFITNIGKFAPLLDSLNNQTFNPSVWTEAIISVNDEHLTRLWKKYAKVEKLQEKWKQLLASWQIKCDTCKSFTCNTSDNIAAYNLPNGDAISLGIKYQVESPCWVMTVENAEGKTIKTVINKGVVTPIETA